jgi:segregation and condensation protein A
MLETEISVKIDHFDGPLALLLHLIQKDEIDVRELDITRITQQYLDYLQKMHNLNFDVAGEYLYMAATLLYLKSRVCIADPSEEKIQLKDEQFEITSKSELIKRLEELERYQRLGERLWALPKKGHEVFIKPKVNRKAIVNSILTPIDLENLTNVMVDFIRKEKRKYTVIKRDRLSIKEKLKFLKEKLSVGEHTELNSLIESDKGIIDIVITFISLLELARLKKVEIFQNEDRGNIYVDVVSSLDSFDVETANGFEAEGEQEAPAQLQ